jgi:hypothetical protein
LDPTGFRFIPTGAWPATDVPELAEAVIMFRWIVLKMHQTQTFLATIENDHRTMKTLAVISILALLTITGAAYSDQRLTSEQMTAQRTN